MLEARAISAGYGPMTVLRDIDLAVTPGEMVLVLGPNGAGKTTLLRALSGLVPISGGELRLDDRVVNREGTERLARAGVRHVLEGHRIFPELTVEDNIRLGQLPLRSARRRKDREVFDEAFDVFPVLGEKKDLLARSLSGGQQQMLALVQAWAAQPRYLLCDEPSMGLALSLVPDILAFLRRRAEEGMGVVLVEQLVDQCMAVADRVVLLRQGEVKVARQVGEFASRDEVVELMLG